LTGLISVVMTYKTLGTLDFISTTGALIIKSFFYVTLICLIINYFSKKEIYSLKLILVYLLYNIIQIFYGFIVAETYWDFKGLTTNAFWLLLPLVAYVGSDELLVKKILSYYVYFAGLILIAIAPTLPSVGFGYYLIPFTFFVLFLPAVNFRMKVIAICIVIFIVLVNLFSRSNMIKYIVPLLLGMSYLFYRYFSIKTFNILRYGFFILPFIFLVSAVSGSFNIFKFNEFFDEGYVAEKSFNSSETKDKDMLGDTRTFLYIEVFNSAKIFDSWYVGRSPARGNISQSFGHLDMNGRGERASNEVNILNIFTWTGVIGIILFSSIFFKAAGLAINQSNNIYCKVLGVFISFKWAYGWVEEFSRFDINFIMTWLFIGMCFSKKIRSMTNDEFKAWGISIGKVKFKFT
jgi:hypothetical protein